MEFNTPFIFQRSPKIIFGAGEVKKIGSLASEFGKNILIVRGRGSLVKSPAWKTVQDSLSASAVSFIECIINGEPSPQSIDSAVEQFSGSTPDCVVAIGGGKCH